jgi:hypothetical protein
MSLAFETTPGRKGATSARREALDPINLVSRVMKKHPHAGVEEVCRRVRTALAGPDAEYQEAFDNYCTRNHFNLLYKEEHGPVRRSSPSGAKATATATANASVSVAEQRRAEAGKAAIKAVELRLLMKISLGCTTMNDLWELGGEAQRLGKKGDRRLVKNVYSVAQLEKAGFGVID